ncbi:MAG: LamG domain-containing protein [Acidimicrobiia bacterium]
MSIKEFRLDRKAAGAQALEGLWGPGPPGDLLYDMAGVGKGNHATRAGTGARSQLSDRGRVLLFNGVDDVWESERSLNIGTEAFTITAWVWLDSTVPGANASFASQGDTAAGEWMFRVVGSNVAGAQLGAYGDTGILNAAAPIGTFHPVKDEWVHVALTREVVAADCHVYQNGALMWTDPAIVNLNTAKAFDIGGADDAAGRWWKGMIDDVRYYSRTLSLGEITHMYNATRYTPYADIALGRMRRYGRVDTGHVRRAAA